MGAETPLSNLVGDDGLSSFFHIKFTVLIVLDDSFGFADAFQQFLDHSFSHVCVWLFLVFHTHPRLFSSTTSLCKKTSLLFLRRLVNSICMNGQAKDASLV